MPIAFREIDGGLGNIWAGSGVITADDLIAGYKHTLSMGEEKQRSFRFNISDYAAVTGTDLHAPDLKRAVEYGKAVYAINPDTVIAILTSGDVLFGLARMWDALMGDPTWETMVFREREDALNWVRQRVRERWDIDNLTFT